MANMNLTYRVTGRYMTGSAVTGYHLVGADGSQVIANKERLIYMIGRGQVENMRLQTNGDDVILRGKGVNLNKLPVFDVSKGEFRGNSASQNAASTHVAPKKNSGINPMGQLTLIKRIMYKTNCSGYVVTDMSGVEKKLSRAKVVELAKQRLISNAIVQRYTPKGSNETQLILRGVGCDISNLPVVTIDQNGNIIDNEDNSKRSQSVYMRAVKMKRAGILYDNKKNRKATFSSGDYIVCGPNGNLIYMKEIDAQKVMTVVNDNVTAVCDGYLDNLDKYPVELFGCEAKQLTPDQVKRWPIVRVSG